MTAPKRARKIALCQAGRIHTLGGELNMSDSSDEGDSSDEFYSVAQRDLQDEFDTRPLADRIELAVVADTLADHHQRFIASRDFFFLATVTADGEPTVSYKGGDVGFVTVIDPKTLAFPLYDGNGMFLSAGNMTQTSKVGMLFIDMETPQRLRVQGHTTIDRNDPLLATYPGALLVCRVDVTSSFINCARYIHKHVRTEASPYVPDENGEQPLPSWKRIDGLQDVMSDSVRAKVDDAGGVITEAEYGAKLLAGDS